MENESKKGKWIKWLVLGLVLANLFVWLVVAGGAPKKDLEVWFFDVGQGDAALAQLGELQILVDGGPNAAVLEKLGRAMPFYDRDIEWLVLSHTDRDHLAGVLAVLENYRVRNIVWSGIGDDDAEDDEWRRLVAAEGAKVITGGAGKKKVLAGPPAGGPELVLEILSPAENERSLDKSQNEFSTAAKIIYGRRSFLFTGDAKSVAGGFAKVSGLPQADILKVAHHGSKYSTAAGFLEQVLPAAAVVSAGAANPYGHPSAEVLEMLAKYGIRTLRTDKNGDIVFRTNGENIFLNTEK